MSVVDQQNAVANAAAETLVLSPDDELYPPLLRLIHDPPDRLYVRGDPSALVTPMLAVVGSRKASPAALRLTRTLCEQAVAAGLHICSGLALGVDAAAHRGGLDAGGLSVAVMATGIDRVYPARHRDLAGQLVQQGCLVSEFPPGTPPRRQHFPQRNRIISGLALGVMVVEAALHSGSLITARFALEQGREVFALPWSVLHRGGAGCLQLIRDGARLVLSIEDVLDELGPLFRLQADLAPLEPKVPDGAAALLRCIGFEAITVDELARASGWPVDRILAELTNLELQGLVSRSSGGYMRC
jgi:DNA processing protein